MSLSASPLKRVLALDTSTERLSIALGEPGVPGSLWTHEGPGGAQASATLLPAIMDLLGQAGWRLDQLDAIAFGCGPGSFTGLRTACAVVQGLAVARARGLGRYCRCRHCWPSSPTAHREAETAKAHRG